MSALSIRNMNHTLGTRALVSAPEKTPAQRFHSAMWMRRNEPAKYRQHWTRAALAALADIRAEREAQRLAADPCSMDWLPTPAEIERPEGEHEARYGY